MAVIGFIMFLIGYLPKFLPEQMYSQFFIAPLISVVGVITLVIGVIIFLFPILKEE